MLCQWPKVMKGHKTSEQLVILVFISDSQSVCTQDKNQNPGGIEVVEKVGNVLDVVCFSR